MTSKPYPRSSITREPALACKRMLDTNVLIDHLYDRQPRYAVVSAWLRRLLRNAPKGRLLIPDAVLHEYLHVTQNSRLLGGSERVSAEYAIDALNSVLRYRSVRVVPNASPSPGRFHRAVLAMRVAPRRRITTDLCIAFTAVQQRAVLCTGDAKDFGAVKEVLPGVMFYDPAGMDE